jgi:methoxymalonate biosynthesis acyl carrier protein
MDVRSTIRRYLDKAITEEFRDDDDIFALGVVDSLFALQLVTFVESEFSITVELPDLDIDNFCSVDALTRLVLGKVEPGHEPPAD